MAVLFGPWIGEFGWEIMAWQAWCREQSKKFDKAYVCSFPDMKPLYEDFAEFIPHNHKGRALDWDREENIRKAEFEMPSDITVQILPFKRYNPGGKFIRFSKMVIPGYTYLIHARAIGRGGKDYPLDRWTKLAEQLSGRGTVASIGSEFDHHVPGTADIRGIPLNELANVMAGCRCVIGGSSGTMHFASLCAPRLVVWGDSRTYYGETLKTRYEKTWNPFNTPVVFIFSDDWKPEVEEVIRAIDGFGSQEQQADITTVVPFVHSGSGATRSINVPCELAEYLNKAVISGRYFITVTRLENEKLLHYYIRNNFPSDDITGSLLHIMNEVKIKELGGRNHKSVKVIDGESNVNAGIDQWT